LDLFVIRKLAVSIGRIRAIHTRAENVTKNKLIKAEPQFYCVLGEAKTEKQIFCHNYYDRQTDAQFLSIVQCQRKDPEVIRSADYGSIFMLSYL